MTPPELKSLRRQAKLAQAQLAERIGIHERNISKWERGVL
jgi:DNA-binding transcriptional regulator YiaG